MASSGSIVKRPRISVKAQASKDDQPIVVDMAAAIVASALLLAIETVVVAMLNHKQLVGPWELRVALSRILPIAILMVIPISISSIAIGRLIDNGQRSARVAVSILSALLAGLLGWGVTFGRHFQQLSMRVAAVVGFVLAITSMTWFLLPCITKARSKFPSLVVVVCTVLFAVLEAANELILPRLYPGFHIALAVLAVALGAWIGRPLARTISPRAIYGAALCIVIISMAVSPWAAGNLRKWDNVRLLYISNAPTLAHALRLASLLNTSTKKHEGAAPVDPQRNQKRWVNWRDRDIFLVSIDAIRADHMGAYGYHRPTTPNIDALAARGVVFERAYTVMPHTSYAMTSLMTGKYIRPLLMQQTGSDSDTLAALVRNYGYRTAAFYPPSLFAVDEERFSWAQSAFLNFEYRK
ncbi:MAG: hypothetical protein CSA75_00480, partial [Sorangium cellulosum]